MMTWTEKVAVGMGNVDLGDLWGIKISTLKRRKTSGQ